MCSALFCPDAVVWGDVANWAQAILTFSGFVLAAFALDRPRQQALRSTRDRIAATSNAGCVEMTAAAFRMMRAAQHVFIAGDANAVSRARDEFSHLEAPALQSVTDNVQVIPEQFHRVLINARWAIDSNRRLVLSDAFNVSTVHPRHEAITSTALVTLLHIENAYNVFREKATDDPGPLREAIGLEGVIETQYNELKAASVAKDPNARKIDRGE